MKNAIIWHELEISSRHRMVRQATHIHQLKCGLSKPDFLLKRSVRREEKEDKYCCRITQHEVMDPHRTKDIQNHWACFVDAANAIVTTYHRILLRK